MQPEPTTTSPIEEKIDLEEKDPEFVPELLERKWEEPQENRDNGQFKFRMMTWNLLANGLSGLYGQRSGKSKTFAGVPDYCLHASYRVPLMLKEIDRWECDVLCFQEFDFYKNPTFMDGLKDRGYVGLYQTKRFSSIVEIEDQLKDLPDGVAIFYRTSKFRAVASYKTKQGYQYGTSRKLKDRDDLRQKGFVSPADIAELGFKKSHVPGILESLVEDLGEPPRPEGWYYEDIQYWMVKQFPVSVGVKLIPLESENSPLYVVASHLAARKKADGDTQRMNQLMTLLTTHGVRMMTEKMYLPRNEARRKVSTFYGFDLNSTYENKQLSYFVEGNDGAEESEGSDAVEKVEKFGACPCYKAILDNKIISATRDVDSGDELPWTSWKVRNGKDGGLQHFQYGVDFIFHQEGWHVTKVSGLPTSEAVEDATHGSIVGLPNPMYPSDHLAICAELQLDLDTPPQNE